MLVGGKGALTPSELGNKKIVEVSLRAQCPLCQLPRAGQEFGRDLAGGIAAVTFVGRKCCPLPLFRPAPRMEPPTSPGRVSPGRVPGRVTVRWASPQPGDGDGAGAVLRARSGTAETLKRPNGAGKAFLRGSWLRVLPSFGTAQGELPRPHPVSVCRLFPGTLDWRCEARALGRSPGGPLTCQHLGGSRGGGWTLTFKARTPLVSDEEGNRKYTKGLVNTC